MAWYNLFRANKKQKSASVDFDHHIEPIPACLKASPLYSHHIVDIHTIIHSYVSLITDKKNQNSEKTRIQTFNGLWCSELERIHKHALHVSGTLKTQIDGLIDILCDTASPLKSKVNSSIYETQKFIWTCLDDIHEYLSNKELLSTKSMHSHFRNCHHQLETRIQTINNERNSTALTRCMEKVYRLEQDLSLYQYYIESQMKLLWSLGHIVHQPSQLTSYWTQKYKRTQNIYEELLSQLKSLLESQLPCPQDVTCVICLSPLHEPVTLKGCHHTFCKDCLQQHYCYSCSFKKRRGFVASWIKSPLIGCTCFALNIDGQLIPAHHQPCPLCRKAFTPQDCELDVELEKLMLAYYKEEDTKRNSRMYFKSCTQYINSSLARISC